MQTRSRSTPTMFVSRSGGRILDFIEEVDLLPASVRVVVLHCGTNDMPFVEPKLAISHYQTLLERIRARGGIEMAVCTLVLPRSYNRRRPFIDRRREFQCNPRAHAFNRQLVQLCRRSRDLFYLDHGFYRRRPTHVLAADGLHPNFEGVRMMSCHLQDLIPHLLRQLPPRRADAPVNPDPVWPTPQEAAMLRRRHSERTSRARKQD
ncbi:uncharacterized protein LOC135392988 isoform X1 [Ornithodoros turicata]|uniref:uncharacterized protein LOC135392988 isoform X1 n=1 Tax=Ornithodoros turicata TaxID=34597 RepID=UPI00313934B2